MLITVVTPAFGANRDLKDKATGNVISFDDYVWNDELFDELVWDDALDEYYVEVNEEWYEAKKVNDKMLSNPELTLAEAVEDMEPVGELEDGDLEVIEVSAINAKGLKVVFNRPITKEEAAKDLEVEIKRGNVPVNQADVEFTEDLKTLEIELVTKLRKGEYTVAVKGLTDEALTGSVEVEDEKVAKIELGDKAALVRDNNKKATVAYKVLNQYGEDITKTITAGKDANTEIIVSAVGATIGNVDNKKGLITLGNVVDFKLDDKIRITAVHGATGTVASNEVVISEPATVGSIEFVKIYNMDDKELNNNTIKSDDFYILTEVKDQYGNELGKENIDNINADIVVTSTNPVVAKTDKFTTVSVDGKDKLALKLDAEAYNKAGNATIRIVTTRTGKTFEHDVTVNEASELAEFILYTPEELVVEGEKVEIPFTALDQFGNEITKYEDLKGKVSFSFTPNDKIENEVDVDVEKDPVTKKPVLEIKPVTGLDIEEGKTQVVVMTAIVSETAKTSQIKLEINPEAQPEVVGGLKDVEKSVTPKSTLEIKAENVVVYDQHSREMKLDSDFFNEYNIKVAYNYEESKDEYAVKITNDSITGTKDTDGTIKLEGVKKGSEEFKLFLADDKGNQAKGTEAYVFTVECVDKTAIGDYVIDDIDPILINKDGKVETSPKIKVYGVKADGSKVAISDNYYTVNTNSDLVTYDGEKFEAKTGLKKELDDKDEITLTLTFVISADGKPVTLTKDVVVKYADNKIAEIELDEDEVEDSVATLSAKDGKISYDAINGLFVYKDQYGNEMEDENPAISITNFVGLDGKEFDGAKTINEKNPFNILQDKVVAEFNATVATDKASKTVKVIVNNVEEVAQEAIKEEAEEHVGLDLSEGTITIIQEDTQLTTFVNEKNLNLAIAAGITEVECGNTTIKINKNTDLDKVEEQLGEKTLGNLAEKESITVTIDGETLELEVNSGTDTPESEE